MASLLVPSTSVCLRANECHQFSFQKLPKIVVCNSVHRSSLQDGCKFLIVPISSSSTSGSFVYERPFEVRCRFSKFPPNIRRIRLSISQRSDVFESQVNGGSDELEGELQGLFDKIKIMIKSGKADDAWDLLQANHEAVMELIDSGSQGAEEAASLDTIALGYMAIGDLRTVESIMEVLSKVVNGLKDEELFVDSVLMHMGSLYAKLGKLDASISSYKRSLQIKERNYGNKSSFLCILLLGMAEVLVSSRRFSEAIDTYDRAITILELSKNVKDEDLIVPLCEIGNLLLKEGRTSDAEYTFSRVLDTLVRLHGEKDGRVGMAMCSLAQVKCAEGEVNQAIDLYKNAIQILNQTRDMDMGDEVLEKIRIDLAELLHAVGRAEEGRAMLEESLRKTEKFKGKGHPSIVPQLVNLASSHSHSKNFSEAERLLRIALQVLIQHVPPDDPSVTFPMLHLATTLYSLHRFEEAETFALDVVRIREKAFGKESLPVGEALDCLVCIQIKLEKDEGELMELLKTVLRIQEIHFGNESGEVLETLKKMVYLLDKMGGSHLEKRPLKRRLTMLRNKHKQMVPY